MPTIYQGDDMMTAVTTDSVNNFFGSAVVFMTLDIQRYNKCKTIAIGHQNGGL